MQNLEFESPEKRREELKEIIHHFYQSPELHIKLMAELTRFKAEHPDAKNYLIFHDALGSTPPNWVVEMDTPNHDVENLILELDEAAAQKAA
ncbi:MAG: hypothetical protein NVS3B9_3840 [Candidatus Doudnabacteria bacterium]